jgi:hypothetical protein
MTDKVCYIGRYGARGSEFGAKVRGLQCGFGATASHVHELVREAPSCHAGASPGPPPGQASTA